MSTRATAAGQRGPDGRRLRWAAHRTERRAAFVAAGVAAVDKHGPAASAEQVAELASVSRTVLYRYFRDKDDLSSAIATAIAAQLFDQVLPHLRLDVELTPREVITGTVDAGIGWFDEHPNLYKFLRERRNGHRLEGVETTLADRVATLLHGLMHAFDLDPEDVEPCAYGIVGYVEASCAWWLANRDESRALGRGRFTASVCDAVWRLLNGYARANGLNIGYEDRLPVVALAVEAW